MRRMAAPIAAADLGLAPVAGFAVQPAVLNSTVGEAGAALHDAAQLQPKFQSEIDPANAEAVQAFSPTPPS